MQIVGGMTLFERALRQAQVSAEKVVVSTDIPEILNRKWGYDVEVIERPPELATPTASKWDVFRHIAVNFKCARIIDLDVGCPFRTIESIQLVIGMLDNYEIAQTMYIADRNPYFNMVDDTGRILCSSEKPVVNSQDAPIVYALSPAVFGLRIEALGKYEHWSQTQIGRVIIPREWAWDIDTPFDLEVAKLLAERRKG